MRDVLFVTHSQFRCGVHMFGREVAAQLAGSTLYNFKLVECNSLIEFAEAVDQNKPYAIVFNYHPTSMPWGILASALCSGIPTVGLLHDVTSDMADNWPDLSFDIFIVHDPDLVTRNPHFVAAARPIPVYNPKSQPPKDGAVRIGSFGFASADKGFEELVLLAQRSFERCIIRLRIAPSDFGDPDGKNAEALVARCRSLITREGVEIETSNEFLERDALLEFLASNDINALLYEPKRGAGGTSSAGDWLVAAQRPVAFRRGIMFRNFNSASPSVFIDDLDLKQILANGSGPAENLRAQWTPAHVIRNYEDAVVKAVSRVSTRNPTLSRPSAIVRSAIGEMSQTIEQQKSRLNDFEREFTALHGQITALKYQKSQEKSPVSPADRVLIDRFSKRLDEIEKIAPMRGGFSRIDPYVFERDQFGHKFRIIIFHSESASWYGNENSEWSLMRLRDHNWLSQGEVVFDLGCNIGFNTMWYAMEVGRTGHVHAFDPFPWNTAAVEFNAELNSLTNVTAHTVGLADKAYTLPISISDARILNGAKTQTFDAIIRPITDYANLLPTFMKIDIEGAEYEVSLSNFRKFQKLRAMYIELHEPFIRERNLDPRVCVENFYRHGFDIHIEEPGAKKYQIGQAEDAGGYLYLLRRNETVLERLKGSFRQAVG
jgi:FkbM family methyltransferase